MYAITIISLLLWTQVSHHSLKTYFAMKDAGMSRREITAITILLLSWLNIVRNVITIFLGTQPTGHLLLEYFFIGSSLFQILLCNMVLRYIENKQE